MSNLEGEDFAYWGADFAPIVFHNPIDTQDRQLFAKQTATLYTTVDVAISADNSTDARLEHASSGDYLVTTYRLSFDGDGISATGASETARIVYNDFLSTPLTITHVGSDNEVNIALEAQCYNNTDTVADAGAYSAEQTLTITW